MTIGVAWPSPLLLLVLVLLAGFVTWGAAMVDNLESPPRDGAGSRDRGRRRARSRSPPGPSSATVPTRFGLRRHWQVRSPPEVPVMKVHVAGRWLVGALVIPAMVVPALDGVAAPLHRPDRPPVAETAVVSASLSDLPPAAQAQVSAALGRDQPSYHAVPQAGGFRVENSRHGLEADFTPAAVRVRAGTASWELSLLGYGYSDAPSAAAAVAPQAAANRVEYRRGDLTEWYLNGPLGLEQGFTLAKPPGKSMGEPLTLAFKLSGNLIASADATGKDVILSRDGTAALRYRGLTANDAAGRALRSWLQVEGERLWLRVDDTGARYPLVVDPFIEQARLTASDGAAGDLFGNVAVDGDTSWSERFDDVDAKVDQGLGVRVREAIRGLERALRSNRPG